MEPRSDPERDEMVIAVCRLAVIDMGKLVLQLYKLASREHIHAVSAARARIDNLRYNIDRLEKL